MSIKRIINIKNFNGQQIADALAEAEKGGQTTLWLWGAEIEVFDID